MYWWALRRWMLADQLDRGYGENDGQNDLQRIRWCPDGKVAAEERTDCRADAHRQDQVREHASRAVRAREPMACDAGKHDRRADEDARRSGRADIRCEHEHQDWNNDLAAGDAEEAAYGADDQTRSERDRSADQRVTRQRECRGCASAPVIDPFTRRSALTRAAVPS